MNEPRLRVTRRRLPHWTLDGSTYFVTFRLAKEGLSPIEVQLVLDHIRSGHDRYYHLAAAVVMPDHVHLVLKPTPNKTLSQIMKGIKGVSAKQLNLLRGTHGSIWQVESYDRIIRDENEFFEKVEYMLNNPVRAGLCEDGWTYPGWYYNPNFE